MLLRDKVVLVTGGGRGIGVGIVNGLAREGATIAINYCTSAEKAVKVMHGVEERGGKAAVFCCDVRDADAVKSMVDAVVHQFGRIDGVINNAFGGDHYGPVETRRWEDFQDSFDFSTKAVLNTLHAARPYMKQQGGGRIINIVTEMWNMAPSGWSTYITGKGAMIGLSRILADELGPEGITVNMVAPGWMKDEKVTGDTSESSYVKAIPLGYQGDAEEIGKVCAFVMSYLADFVSGAFIPVAGGRMRMAGG